MPTPKLPIGCGIARAKRNRSPRSRAALNFFAFLTAVEQLKVEPAAKPLKKRRIKLGGRS